MSNRRKTPRPKVKFRPGAPCTDCHWPTFQPDQPDEHYMVTDDVWAQAGMNPSHIPWNIPGVGEHYYLCIGCLEIRLGRELAAADFTDCPLNKQTYRQTRRLRNRLART